MGEVWPLDCSTNAASFIGKRIVCTVYVLY